MVIIKQHTICHPAFWHVYDLTRYLASQIPDIDYKEDHYLASQKVDGD